MGKAAQPETSPTHSGATHRCSFIVGAAALPLLPGRASQAAERDVLVVAVGDTVNSLDIHHAGTNRTSY
jgi:peptide/nickel transport system substrate-binding protein